MLKKLTPNELNLNLFFLYLIESCVLSDQESEFYQKIQDALQIGKKLLEERDYLDSVHPELSTVLPNLIEGFQTYMYGAVAQSESKQEQGIEMIREFDTWWQSNGEKVETVLYGESREQPLSFVPHFTIKQRRIDRDINILELLKTSG